MGATSNEGTGVGSVEKSFSRLKNNIKKENFAPNAFGHISFDGVKIQGGENNWLIEQMIKEKVLNYNFLFFESRMNNIIFAHS